MKYSEAVKIGKREYNLKVLENKICEAISALERCHLVLEHSECSGMIDETNTGKIVDGLHKCRAILDSRKEDVRNIHRCAKIDATIAYNKYRLERDKSKGRKYYARCRHDGKYDIRKTSGDFFGMYPPFRNTLFDTLEEAEKAIDDRIGKSKGFNFCPNCGCDLREVSHGCC